MKTTVDICDEKIPAVQAMCIFLITILHNPHTA